MSENIFYLIWNPTGSRPPKVKHASELGKGGAREAAQNMARKHPECEFYVMMAMSVSVVKPPVPVTTLLTTFQRPDMTGPDPDEMPEPF